MGRIDTFLGSANFVDASGCQKLAGILSPCFSLRAKRHLLWPHICCKKYNLY